MKMYRVSYSVKKIAAVVACLCTLVFYNIDIKGQQLSDQPLSPRIANYNIDVRLEPEKRLLHGKETITWYNRSQDTIEELQFHLYLNAFRNNKSTVFKEAKELLKYLEFDTNGWGGIEINRINLKDE